MAARCRDDPGCRQPALGKPDSARAGRGYEGRAVRERPLSDEEAAPAWAVKLQRELRASLREDLARVLRELTDAKPDSTRPRRLSADEAVAEVIG